MADGSSAGSTSSPGAGSSPRVVRVFDQHRGLREGTLEAVAQLAAITRNRKPLPVALDDIHLAIRTVAAPPEDDGLRRRLVAGLADLETRRRGRDRIPSLLRALRVAEYEHRNGVTPTRIAAMQGFA